MDKVCPKIPWVIGKLDAAAVGDAMAHPSQIGRIVRSQEKCMELQINDQSVTVVAEPDLPLLWVLRDLLGMTGTKFGCGMALCGACTVLVDGQAVRSCVLPVAQAAGKKITTIEGVGSTPVGAALQGAWQEINVPQCGYCQAGQIMSAAALLQVKPQPSDTDIDAAMSGNICRCGTYARIRTAIKQAATHVGQTK
jgi:isoquinoline 1-oxidoreductase alpha subunit